MVTNACITTGFRLLSSMKEH